MCLNIWNSIIFVCVPKVIITVLEQYLLWYSVSVSCFCVSLLYATENPGSPLMLRGMVKKILCIYKLMGDKRSACFVFHVVGRSTVVFVHINVFLFRWELFGWAVTEKHLPMWRMWDQSITFPGKASLDTTFHTTIQQIMWAPWWLFTLRNHEVSLCTIKY
jgi:hypothetical protein